jgi:hypothetical protein
MKPLLTAILILVLSIAELKADLVSCSLPKTPGGAHTIEEVTETFCKKTDISYGRQSRPGAEYNVGYVTFVGFEYYKRLTPGKDILIPLGSMEKEVLKKVPYKDFPKTLRLLRSMKWISAQTFKIDKIFKGNKKKVGETFRVFTLVGSLVKLKREDAGKKYLFAFGKEKENYYPAHAKECTESLLFELSSVTKKTKEILKRCDKTSKSAKLDHPNPPSFRRKNEVSSESGEEE